MSARERRSETGLGVVDPEGIPSGADFTFGPSGSTTLTDGTTTSHLGYTASAALGKLNATVALGGNETYFQASSVPASVAVDTSFGPVAKTAAVALGAPIAQIKVMSRRVGTSFSRPAARRRTGDAQSDDRSTGRRAGRRTSQVQLLSPVLRDSTSPSSPRRASSEPGRNCARPRGHRPRPGHDRRAERPRVEGRLDAGDRLVQPPGFGTPQRARSSLGWRVHLRRPHPRPGGRARGAEHRVPQPVQPDHLRRRLRSASRANTATSGWAQRALAPSTSRWVSTSTWASERSRSCLSPTRARRASSSATSAWPRTTRGSGRGSPPASRASTGSRSRTSSCGWT